MTSKVFDLPSCFTQNTSRGLQQSHGKVSFDSGNLELLLSVLARRHVIPARLRPSTVCPSWYKNLSKPCIIVSCTASGSSFILQDCQPGDQTSRSGSNVSIDATGSPSGTRNLVFSFNGVMVAVGEEVGGSGSGDVAGVVDGFRGGGSDCFSQVSNTASKIKQVIVIKRLAFKDR